MHIRWNKTWGIPAISGVTSFVAGTGVGYVVAANRFLKRIKDIEESQRILREHFESRMEAINEETKEDKNMGIVKDIVEQELREYSIAENGIPQVSDDTPYLEEEGELVPVPLENHSVVFSENDADNWDYEVEVPKRGDRNPYVIHHDEFFDQESGFSQSTLTYYAGDNILCDEREQPIYNQEIVAGALRFGHGSKDPNIVYIRNPQLQAEYEVVCEDGHYQVEVLGAVIEDEMSSRDLKHSLHKFQKD